MITAVVVLPPVFWLIRLAGVVWSEAAQDQPLGAVSESPIVIVTVQVPVVPLANDPAVAPPTVVLFEQPEAVNLVPATCKEDNRILPVVSVMVADCPMSQRPATPRASDVSAVLPGVVAPRMAFGPTLKPLATCLLFSTPEIERAMEAADGHQIPVVVPSALVKAGAAAVPPAPLMLISTVSPFAGSRSKLVAGAIIRLPLALTNPGVER